MIPSHTHSCRRDSWTLAPSATPRSIPPVANRLLRERIERPVKALPMLQPPETVPPNPMSSPPANRRGSSRASGTCQRAVPIDRALSQLPRGTPSTINAPQVIGWEARSTSAPRSVRLGPVIDSPQCHPAGAPASQASDPRSPSVRPVVYQGQPARGEGFGSSHSKTAISTTNLMTTHMGLEPSSADRDAGPKRNKPDSASHNVTARRRPCAASSPPNANPSTAIPAPRFPVPTRDQREVAQPLAHTIPKPKITPPMIAANQVNGGIGTKRT